MNQKLRAGAVYAAFGVLAVVLTFFTYLNIVSIKATAATVGAGVSAVDFGGRCTLTSATPVLTASVLAATTLYYTPYKSDRITLYNGSDLVLYEFAELSNITTNSSTGQAGPAATAASSVYDYFVWYNGTTLVLTRGPAWTSATARSLTLTRTRGLWVNTSAITNGPAASRGTYVCTASTDAAAVLNYKFGTIAAGGGQAILTVWNMHNRVSTSSGIIGETADTWTPQAGGTLAAVNASASNSAIIVRGLDEDAVKAYYNMECQANNNIRVTSGIGVDSVTVGTGSLGYILHSETDGTATRNLLQATYDGLPGIGVHTLTALEQANGTATCLGDGGAATAVQNGLAVNQMM